MHFDALADGLVQADLVIVASGAPHIVLHAADIERAMVSRTKRPLVVIDLAVPRNVDPTIRDIVGTHVYDMDDLNVVVASQHPIAATAVAAAEKIAEEETQHFLTFLSERQLAPFVLDAFGLHRFAILYVWTGIAGFFVSYLAGVPFTIGASAPVCGLIGAILYYGKSRGGFYGEVIYRQAMGWVVGLVLFGLFLPGINNWAHGGGIVSGLLLAFITGYRERRKETSIHRILGTGSIVISAAALLWAVIQAIYHRMVL
jgi:hypothetical protein